MRWALVDRTAHHGRAAGPIPVAAARFVVLVGVAAGLPSGAARPPGSAPTRGEARCRRTEGLDPPSAWRRAEDTPACVQSLADVGGDASVFGQSPKFEQRPNWWEALTLSGRASTVDDCADPAWFMG